MYRALRFYSKTFSVLTSVKCLLSGEQKYWMRACQRGLSVNLSQSIKEEKVPKRFHPRGSLLLESGCLTVDSPRWTIPLTLSLRWLRDQCQCSLCKDPETGLRLAIQPPIKVEVGKAIYRNDTLTLAWTDGHMSSFHNDWLVSHSFEGKPCSAGLPKKTIWNADVAKTIDLAKLDYDDFMHNEDDVKTFLDSVLKYGIGIVENVPVTSEHTRKVMERNGPIWRTFWGEMYHVVADLTQHTHPSYTGADLAYHTDTNYYFEGAGLQAFHVLEHTGEGANNKFVDGFFVVDAIRRKHPDVFEFLSTNPVSFKYRETGKLDLKNEDVLLKFHPVTKELVQLRFTPYDFDVFRTAKAEETDLYYHSLHTLATEIKAESNTHWIQLRPGTVLVTDNWRVLHGRTPFTGKRTLCGMYVSRSDFLSRARRFGLVA